MPDAAIPGGWLDQPQVDALRRAISAERRRVANSRANVADRLRAIDAVGDAHTTQPERDLIRLYDERIAALDAAEAPFIGMEHGARVEALPSPADEEAQELRAVGEELRSRGHIFWLGSDDHDGAVMLTAFGRARLTEVLGRDPTPNDIDAIAAALHA